VSSEVSFLVANFDVMCKFEKRNEYMCCIFKCSINATVPFYVCKISLAFVITKFQNKN
jgi:hypothetical protein